jgi:hypothetical protein
MSVKWTMKNSKSFVGEKEGYVISLSIGSLLGPIWTIKKDKKEVDSCYNWGPIGRSFNSELAGRAQAERALGVILAKQEKVVENVETIEANTV